MERSLSRSVRWLLGLLLGGVCVTLHLFGEDLPTITDAMTDVVTLPQSHTIVAYSLDYLVEIEQRTPITCQNVLLRPRLGERRKWQQPSHTNLFLYSAYYDTRLSPYNYVRIVGMAEGNSDATVYCHVWFDDDRQPLILEAIVSAIWVSSWDENTEDINTSYTPVLISCPIPRNVGAEVRIPVDVSLTKRPCKNSNNQLPVNRPMSDKLKNFAVCVKGMDFPSKDISARLVEWFEFNRLLGADFFFIYVYSVHENVKKVLNYYSSIGVASVKELTLPGRQPNSPLKRSRYLRTHIWQKRRDELVPYNDCLYRSLYSHRYVLPLDVDEFVVPVQGSTWSDVLMSVDAESLPNYASFSVRSAYYFDAFPPVRLGAESSLHVLRHIVRSADLSEAVKSFVSCNNTLTVFNHYSLRPLDPALGRNLVLNSTIARVNHYKSECSPLLIQNCDKLLKFTKLDPVILKYAKKLTRRVESVLKYLRFI